MYNLLYFCFNSGDQKCCYNGCGGMACITAAEDPGMVDYTVDEIAPVDPNAPIIEVVEPTVFVAEGDVAELGVRVSGRPAPDVYWRKDGRNIDTLRGRFRLVGGGSLQIVGARPTDAGRYDCLADNGRGPPVSASLSLNVGQPRELAADIMDNNAAAGGVVMSLGAPATLYCLAYGWPRPTVTWWKGTKILPLRYISLCNGTTGCSLNIVLFSKILKYSGLLPLSVFPRCGVSVCRLALRQN